MFPVATLLASLLVGLGGGLLLVRVLGRGLLHQAERDAAALRAQTGAETAALGAEARERAERQRLELERRSRDELARERADLEEYEGELGERESLLASREAQLDGAEEAARVAEERIAALGARADELRAAADAALERTLQGLEERASLTREAALSRTIRERVGRFELATARRLRRAEEQIEQNAVPQSRRVMTVAVDRYQGVGHLERIHNTIAIPDRATLLALGDPGGPAYAVFQERIGCELWCDEEGGSLTVRGDDPLAREVARRVLRQLANRAIGDPDRVREIADTVLDEVHREVHNAARKAARALGLGPMDPAIAELVGRLKFRLSYSQNQWKHAIEVGHLAGMMAEELGLDVGLARRGGLLHDIGKAMTHEREGAHAVLGAEVARRCGEHETVANAIGSHHNDEPPATAIAHVVTAADAMSGARPGARREHAAAYLGRIQDIQRIAAGFPAVERVDIMHAGREVRVVVAGDERGDVDDRAATRHGRQLLRDHDLHPLAQDISRAIEEEITFAGQIRVTVIRETRSVAVAR